mmetsp:Transcript_62869/g.101691  ORF Transcript_62869/g.101691 Transcript_62869/m.101691 type:complete len:298 (-) Transcript_62869:53-946(-)
MDDNMTARLKALHDSWDAESKDKQRKLDEHMEAIKKNLAETDRKKEDEVQKLLAAFDRKEAQVVKMREAVYGGGAGEDFDGAMQEQAAKAQQKRDEISKNAEVHTKQLIAKHQQKEAQTKAKEIVRQEKLREIAKERKDREAEMRKRMADIQKKKKEILKEREEKVLEHMDNVDAHLKQNREKKEKDLELKVELERIKSDQAQENVRREKARQRQESRELQELHDDLSAIKRNRDEALDKLKRERQLQATKIRLHKDELREEVFSIQVNNSWGKAAKLLNSWQKDGVVPALPPHTSH